MGWVVRLALLSLCALLGPAAAVAVEPPPATIVGVYTYDASHHMSPVDAFAPERGPPDGTRVSDVPAGQSTVDASSHRSSASPNVAATYRYTTYGVPASLAQVDNTTGTSKESAETIDGDVRAVQLVGVAANAERRVFSNLAPGDAVRQAGFHAISPTSLKGVSGRYNYVVGTDGRLVIGNRRFGHIDLANGGNVLAAGEFRIVQGQVRSINNASGHYRPVGPSAQAAAEQAFGSSGLMVRSGAYTEIVP